MAPPTRHAVPWWVRGLWITPIRPCGWCSVDRVELDVLARRQYGVLTTGQAVACGLTPDALRCRVESGRWRRLARGLYLAHSGELDWWARASAAVLRAGPGSALAAETAVFLHGMTDRPSPVIVVAVPVERHPIRLPGTRVRRRRRLEIVTRHRLPVTTAEQTVIDVAAAPGTGWREAVNVCARAVQRRRATAQSLAAELAAHARHPHREVLQVALGVVARGAQTAAEVEYQRRVERPHALPASLLQVVSDDGGSRRDLEYLPWKVVVEIDGSVHAGVVRRVADRLRDRRAAGAGRVTLRVENVEVFAMPCELAVDVICTLRQRGFRGPVAACRPSCPVASVVEAA